MKQPRKCWKNSEAVYGHKSEASLHILEQKFYAATYDKDGGIGAHKLCIAKLECLGSQMKALGEQYVNGKDSQPEFAHFHSAWDKARRKILVPYTLSRMKRPKNVVSI